MSGIDNLNRAALIVLALLLIAGAGLALATGYGAFGDEVSGRPVFLTSVDDFLSRSSSWFWPLIAMVALVIAWLGYRWLRAQIPSPSRPPDVELASSPDGHTVVKPSALADALVADVEKSGAVRSASSTVNAQTRPPEVEVTVDVTDDGLVDEVRDHIQRYALARLEQAIGSEGSDVHVLVKVGGAPGRQLR
jgi:hypothetical protein